MPVDLEALQINQQTYATFTTEIWRYSAMI